MKHRKIILVVFFLLVSFASIAFASLSMMLPLEKSPLSFGAHEVIRSGDVSVKPAGDLQQVIRSNTSLNYHSWRKIHSSA